MVQTLIMTCNRCELGKTANRVPYGGVTWKPKLILLGEAPGSREDRLREPFVGPAGLLLDQILGMVGLSRHQVMIANTICCRPPRNRDPEWSEIMACRINRNSQISLGRTWVGVTLGRIALGTLLEDPGRSIGTYKGKPFWKDDMVWMPTYHPAYGLRNKSAISEIASHIKMALDIYHGDRQAPIPKTRGYSMTGRVLVVDHEGVKVPPRVREMAQATFTKEEWARVRYTPEAKQAAIRLKMELEATVVS
jgi:DNA polymerase